MTYEICGFNKLSTIDYPGEVCSVIYFSGCNLRCNFCQNKPLVNREEDRLSWPGIKDYLIRRKEIIKAVLISGGEATIHTTDLLRCVQELRELGLKIGLQTNGLKSKIIKLISPDFLSVSVKSIPIVYKQLGCKMLPEDVATNIMYTLNYAANMDSSECVIVPVKPYINYAIIEHLARDFIPKRLKLVLQKCNMNHYNGPETTQEEFDTYVKICKRYNEKVVVR